MEINFSDLKELNVQIKSPLTRQTGFDSLLTINREALTAGMAMYHTYLKGKYYSLCFKEYKDLSYLFWANDHYDDVVTIAYKHGIRPKNPKYLFKRAHTKFLLSQIVVQKASRKHYYKKACQLTDIGLQYHKANASFRWLKGEL